MKRKLLIAVFSMFALGMLSAMPQASINAQDELVTETTQSDTNVSESYVFEAQPGDSYSVLARKATQIYGIQSSTNLSLAQIIYVETNLTQNAGSPQLNQGQQVTFNTATVKEWADKALVLDDEQEAAWNYYVQFTDFNTNNAGERRE